MITYTFKNPKFIGRIVTSVNGSARALSSVSDQFEPDLLVGLSSFKNLSANTADKVPAKDKSEAEKVIECFRIRAEQLIAEGKLSITPPKSHTHADKILEQRLESKVVREK